MSKWGGRASWPPRCGPLRGKLSSPQCFCEGTSFLAQRPLPPQAPNFNPSSSMFMRQLSLNFTILLNSHTFRVWKFHRALFLSFSFKVTKIYWAPSNLLILFFSQQICIDCLWYIRHYLGAGDAEGKIRFRLGRSLCSSRWWGDRKETQKHRRERYTM